MATYRYQAFDKNENKVKGFITADSKSDAINQLQLKELNPSTINEATKEKSNLKISKKDLSIFTKQVSALLSSGTPIEKTLEIVSNQTNKDKFSQILHAINEELKQGKSLSDCMRGYPRVFDSVYCSTVFAGETSASLPTVFKDLSDYLDKEIKIRSQVIGALTYPAIIFSVSIVVIYALLSFVLPQVVDQFISSNVSLPALTTALLYLSDIFPAILILVLLIFLGPIYLVNSNWLSLKRKLDISKIFLNIPFFGKIILFDQTARFCSSMHLMTKAGLNTIESLNIAKESFNNLYLRLELDVIENRVISGSSLSQSFSESKVFPRVFVQLLISGDMGGKVSEMFEKIKNYLDQEVESVRNIMLTFLQPSIILVMGVFVLLIVLSIMLPLLQMNNLIFNL